MVFDGLRHLMYQLKRQALTVYCVARHRCTPWLVRLLALMIAAYAFSPIDLIPDFIPLLGMLDDLIIVPLGLALVIRLTPVRVLCESRDKARAIAEKPVSYSAAAVVLVVWVLVAIVAVRWVSALI